MMNLINLAQIGAEMSSSVNNSHTATIVCLKDVTGNKLSGESWDNYYEHELKLSASNYANSIPNTWP